MGYNVESDEGRCESWRRIWGLGRDDGSIRNISDISNSKPSLSYLQTLRHCKGMYSVHEELQANIIALRGRLPRLCPGATQRKSFEIKETRLAARSGDR